MLASEQLTLVVNKIGSIARSVQTKLSYFLSVVMVANFY
jgi:hypothetical protein